VGASEWWYVVPYQDDLGAALEALRRRVFADGDFVSPTDFGLPEPETVDDLAYQEIYEEFMGANGTHSIIDIAHGVPHPGGGFRGDGTIRPLTDEESRRVFGSARPSRADFDEADRRLLQDLVTGGRWTGRAVVLWAGDNPDEIAFWGYSGD
jgi:hypothetical protein